MTWNFHSYYIDNNDGLISKLKLPATRIAKLKELRALVRNRTKEVFQEAKELVKTSSINASFESISAEVAKTRLRYLSLEAQIEATNLLREMDDDARKAFLTLNPRFWTQGSFQYDTLNIPYATPPQEMDIDDGTYLPMAIFEGRPVIGHRLLLLLVDSSLNSLVHENKGWIFEAKRTCARIKIPAEHTHIDVPMYAIPEDQFLLKEAAIAKSLTASMEAIDSINGAIPNNRADYSLDEDCVNLALREDDQKWMKSDPKTVENWFNDSCMRIGPHLRSICRIMKAWRDVQWPDGGGPSSISLMAATVNILDRIPHNSNDFSSTMLMLASNIKDEFCQGIESPDETDEKLLFPHLAEHGEREHEVIKKLTELHATLISAQQSPSREIALKKINQAFGDRVDRSDLIVSEISAPAFMSEPKRGTKPVAISSTMASG